MIDNKWKKIFALFIISQAISLFGSSLVQYAITWYITLETGSGTMMTIAIVCGFFPTFLISPFAGVWADRYNKKFLIAASDSLIALSTLVLAILFFMGYKYIWLLFVFLAIRGAGSGIQSPAVNAYLPFLVPKERLTKVNSITSIIQSSIALFSPMLSALLTKFASIQVIFFIDVFTAMIAVFILLFLLRATQRITNEEKQNQGYFSDLHDGLKYITRHRFIFYLCLFNVFFLFLIAPAAFLTPLQVARRFGDDVIRLSALEISFSGGMILGGLLIGVWGGFRNKFHSMVLSNLVISLCTIALGLVPNFWMYLVLKVDFGVAMPVFNVPSNVLLQHRVDKAYLGRVFGVFTMISGVMMPMGMLLFGPLADYVSIEPMLVVTGILLLAEVVIMSFNRTLTIAGKPDEE
jgi:DHA3 family macrolide efflux protein-like MFS transporter